MSKHPRQIIREKVAALLRGRTAAGARVWPSRSDPWRSHHVPAIGVYTVEDESPMANVSPRRYDRTVTVLVECHADIEGDRLDDVLDSLAKQVEDILFADPTWGGVVDDSALMRTSVGYDSNGEVERGVALLVWEADYTTRPGEADPATLNDFRTAHVDWDAAPDPDGTKAHVNATDIITLPTQQPQED